MTLGWLCPRPLVAFTWNDPTCNYRSTVFKMQLSVHKAKNCETSESSVGCGNACQFDWPGSNKLMKTQTAPTLAPLSLAYVPPLLVVTDVEKCHQSQNSVISSPAEGRLCICCGTRTRCHWETCPCTTAVKSSDRQPTNTMAEGESRGEQQVTK